MKGRTSSNIQANEEAQAENNNTNQDYPPPPLMIRREGNLWTDLVKSSENQNIEL